MLYRKPRLSEYILARVVTVSLGLYFLFFIATLFFLGSNRLTWLTLVFVAVAFATFIYIVYRGTKSVQKELSIVNKYLANLEETDVIDYETKFFAKEFEQINENLIKVLKKYKKREEMKQKYTSKLKLKNRQRSDMISAIAHEFRNPIAAIMGYAQTLEDDKDLNEAMRDRFLSKINTNSQKIENLLKRLILWNKFESGDARLEKTKFRIKPMIDTVCQDLREKYKGRHIIVQGEGFDVDADRTLMEVVIKNLIENALKYSDEDVVVQLEGRRLSVVDKGVGISEEHLDKVTKKFYRSGTHNWDNSMGLGLSIVKTILSLHGSYLKIQSKEHEGSTFSFEM
ncbi:MAG: sensor histidine kinase [Campylobacterales bacterium]|nr:sensor histidine kinase [Campylobacterales bacterium]